MVYIHATHEYVVEDLSRFEGSGPGWAVLLSQATPAYSPTVGHASDQHRGAASGASVLGANDEEIGTAMYSAWVAHQTRKFLVASNRIMQNNLRTGETKQRRAKRHNLTGTPRHKVPTAKPVVDMVVDRRRGTFGLEPPERPGKGPLAYSVKTRGPHPPCRSVSEPAKRGRWTTCDNSWLPRIQHGEHDGW